ncbi:MAG: peptidylprolyl isomerase [Phycisphaerae bacterium]
MRQWIPILLSAALLGGCGESRTDTATTTDKAAVSTAPEPTTQPASNSGPKPVMAYVNDEAIPMERLHEILVRSDGLQIAMQLVVNELVDQEARELGITVSQEEIRTEGDSTIARGFGKDLTTEQRDQLLQQYLKQTGIPRTQWDLTMYRNALLGKIVARNIEVTDEQLQDEFGRQFGRKAVVRHIEVSSTADARQVLAQLKLGTDFAQLAYKRSINPTAKDGGLLPPISAESKGVPPAIREIALSMKEVGEISDPIRVGSTFHILKLENIIEPKDADFSEEKERLEKIVRERMVNQRKQTHLMDLYRKAISRGKIEFVNPELKKQFQKRIDEEKTP